MKKLLCLHLLSLGFAFLPAQHLPETRDLYLDHPSHQYAFDWNSLAGAWDSTRMATIGYLPSGKLGLVHWQPLPTGSADPENRLTLAYDAQGRCTEKLAEVDSSGTWENATLQKWGYDSASGIEVRYVWVNWDGSQWDTVSARRTALTPGPGGMPVIAVTDTWSAGNGYRPAIWRDYHYNVNMETDTIWTALHSQVGLDPWEMRVIHGWHDFPAAQADSVTIYRMPSQSSNYALHGAFHTTYNGSLPAFHREWNYSFGSPVSDRVVVMDALGLTVLDSMAMPGGQPVMNITQRHAYQFDGLGRLTQMITHALRQGGYSPYSRLDFAYSAAGVQPSSADLTVTAWPNPVARDLHVALPAHASGPARMTLTDLQGKVRLLHQSTQAAAETILHLGESLPAGTYVLRVETREGVATERVVVGE